MLFIINFFFLQWFFIRLAKIKDLISGKTCGFCLLYNVTPLTGWWSSYNKDYKYTRNWMFRK